MTPEAFEKNIVKITVLNIISPPKILALIGELAQKLSVALNRGNIKKLIIDKNKNRKQTLKKKSNNKFVYLKMDACT